MDTLVATSVIALQQFDNLTLAAANNAINGFGDCGKRCIAYQPMLDAALIREDGRPCDAESLKSALAFEVNRRVEAGTFQ